MIGISLLRSGRRGAGPGAMPSYPRARWRAKSRAMMAARRGLSDRVSGDAPFSTCSSPRSAVHTASTMGHLLRIDSPGSQRGGTSAEPLRAMPVLPIAIAKPHAASGYRSAMLGSLDRWASQRWQFIAPRLIPAALAFVGMLGVLAAMDAMASRCRLEPRTSATIYLVGESDRARL